MTNEFLKLFEIIVASSLINNFVFTRFLGLCIFFGVSKKTETAVGMSITFTAVMMISAAASWLIFNCFMIPLHLQFLKIVVFIGVVACLVQVSDTVMKKIAPVLFHKLGVYLALISTNCIILAVPIINVDEKHSLLESLALALGSGLGFTIALMVMSSLRERLELANIPKPFRGLPIAFVITSMVALAFSGFSGLIAE